MIKPRETLRRTTEREKWQKWVRPGMNLDGSPGADLNGSRYGYARMLVPNININIVFNKKNKMFSLECPPPFKDPKEHPPPPTTT